MISKGRRLLLGDCLLASDVLRELSVNQNLVRAKRRLNMQIINQRRLGKKQSVVFFEEILGTLKNSKRINR